MIEAMEKQIQNPIKTFKTEVERKIKAGEEEIKKAEAKNKPVDPLHLELLNDIAQVKLVESEEQEVQAT